MYYQGDIPSGDLRGTGKPTAPVAIVGDIATGFDLNSNEPFAGPPGTVLDKCLHAAGLIRGNTYLTKVIKERATKSYKAGNEFWVRKGLDIKFTSRGMEHVAQLRDEINSLSCNVIVAAGEAAFSALCSLGKLAAYRGYVFQSRGLNREIKVIPTYSPGSTLRGNYLNQHLLVLDFKKAKVESLAPTYNPPERILTYEYSGYEEVIDSLDFFMGQDVVGCDIEVLNHETSCLSFSSKSNFAISIPLINRWTLAEEVAIRRKIAEVLGNPKSCKVFQNGIFDIHFLATRDGIIVNGPIHDTMIGHSVMYPDLRKGLGFLGSIYCGAQPYWKDAVRFRNIKGDS